MAMMLAAAAAVAGAQGWSPQKNVELVVPNPPGGSNDKTARTVERIWTMMKVLPSTSRPAGCAWLRSRRTSA